MWPRACFACIIVLFSLSLCYFFLCVCFIGRLEGNSSDFGITVFGELTAFSVGVCPFAGLFVGVSACL